MDRGDKPRDDSRVTREGELSPGVSAAVTVSSFAAWEPGLELGDRGGGGSAHDSRCPSAGAYRKAAQVEVVKPGPGRLPEVDDPAGFAMSAGANGVGWCPSRKCRSPLPRAHLGICGTRGHQQMLSLSVALISRLSARSPDVGTGRQSRGATLSQHPQSNHGRWKPPRSPLLDEAAALRAAAAKACARDPREAMLRPGTRPEKYGTRLRPRSTAGALFAQRIARMFAPIGARFAPFSRMFGKVILACRLGAAPTRPARLRPKAPPAYTAACQGSRRAP